MEVNRYWEEHPHVNGELDDKKEHDPNNNNLLSTKLFVGISSNLQHQKLT